MPPKQLQKQLLKQSAAGDCDIGERAETRLKGPQQLRNVVLLDGVAGAGVACVLIY